VSTVTLESEALRAVVDPARGFEIASLVARERGIELLYQAHWERAPLGTPPLDEAAWTAAWGGGWQLLVPNASVACTVGGRRHGYHGDGSVADWELRDEADGHAVGVWSDPSGLACQRRVEVDGPSLTVRTFVENVFASAVPLVLVEHLVLGGPIAGELALIDLPGGRVEPAAWDGRPLAEATPWPLVPDGDRLVDWSRLGPRPLSRFGVVQGLPEGRAHVRNPAAGVGVRLAWPAATMPNLWLWQEGCGTADPPWDGRTACLAIEPSTVSRADGLAQALRRGDAIQLAAGASVDTWVRLELSEGAP
jgi:hypothetical protein